MNHTIIAHNNRQATMMKIRVFLPLQRSEWREDVGVGVRAGGSDMTKVRAGYDLLE